MKRLFLSFCLMTTIVCSNAQKSEPKTYVAYDNSTFTQGDSLHIGFMTGYKCYDYIKDYARDGYVKVEYNLAGKTYKIVDIYTAGSMSCFDANTVIIEIGQKGFFGKRLSVDINNAIRTGEVIINFSPQWRENIKIQNFSDSIAFLYKVKNSQQPPLNFSLEYLRRFNEKNYDKYREDEFELDNQKQISTNKMKENIAMLSDATTYYTDIELNLENYDFSTMSFPVVFEKYYTILHQVRLFSETKLVFVNQNDFEKLPVDKSVANSFIKRRKNSSGYINRTVFARVYFKNIPIPANTTSKLHYINNEYQNYLFGTIQRIEFFDLMNRQYNYIGLIVGK